MALSAHHGRSGYSVRRAGDRGLGGSQVLHCLALQTASTRASGSCLENEDNISPLAVFCFVFSSTGI
jgi:hypothetical protein